MIRVTVELLSAIDGSRTVLAMMDIANDGQLSSINPRLGNYFGEAYRGRDLATLERRSVSKRGSSPRWPRADRDCDCEECQDDHISEFPEVDGAGGCSWRRLTWPGDIITEKHDWLADGEFLADG